jgi:hypothetical protein
MVHFVSSPVTQSSHIPFYFYVILSHLYSFDFSAHSLVGRSAFLAQRYQLLLTFSYQMLCFFLSSDCHLHIPLIAAPILLSDGPLGLSLGLWKLLMVIFLLINCLLDCLPLADISIT